MALGLPHFTSVLIQLPTAWACIPLSKWVIPLYPQVYSYIYIWNIPSCICGIYIYMGSYKPLTNWDAHLGCSSRCPQAGFGQRQRFWRYGFRFGTGWRVKAVKAVEAVEAVEDWKTLIVWYFVSHEWSDLECLYSILPKLVFFCRVNKVSHERCNQKGKQTALNKIASLNLQIHA